MPKIRMNIEIKQKSRIFNKAHTKAVATRAVTAANEALADEAYRRVRARLSQVLKNPTGYYESRIQVTRGTQMRGVDDGGVVYGGWLEGVDSRNKTTRFKGYRTFRTIKQEMQREKGRIAEPIVRRLIRGVK
jgi:hypothetical protein